jgi:hypothetical protein
MKETFRNVPCTAAGLVVSVYREGIDDPIASRMVPLIPALSKGFRRISLTPSKVTVSMKIPKPPAKPACKPEAILEEPQDAAMHDISAAPSYVGEIPELRPPAYSAGEVGVITEAELPRSSPVNPHEVEVALVDAGLAAREPVSNERKESGSRLFDLSCGCAPCGAKFDVQPVSSFRDESDCSETVFTVHSDVALFEPKRVHIPPSKDPLIAYGPGPLSELSLDGMRNRNVVPPVSKQAKMIKPRTSRARFE